MAVELATAYVSIVPETSKIAPGVKQALGVAEKNSESQGKSMGQKISTGMASTLKKTAVGVGAAAGGVLAAGLTKGIGRLSAIEMAEAKLTGLGNSASDVAKIMENANAAVKGTAYGLDEAATTAAMAVAAGIKPGAELEQVLKTTADTAGIAGASMSEMGQIFGSVAAKGKLQGDDMMQLTERGIPVLQLLGKELGKTSAEVSEMVSKGEIDFATFERAMRAGVGGAALEAGNTVQGALSNMGAALGRLGATVAGPFYEKAAGAFTGVTNALDAMNAQAKPVMEQFAGWLDSTAVPALERFGESAVAAFDKFRNSAEVRSAISGTSAAFSQLAQASVALAPSVGKIAAALGEASAALGVSTWKVFVSTLQVAGTVAEALAGPLGVVADFLSDHPALVTAAVAAWAGFKTIPSVVGKVTSVLSPMTGAVEKAKTAMAGIADTKAYFQATGREVSTLGATVDYFAMGSSKSASTWASVANGASNQVAASLASAAAAHVEAGNKIRGSLTQAGSAVAAFSGGALGGLKSAATGVMGLFGGPWGVALAAATAFVTSETSAAASAQAAHEELARSVREGEAAQRDLQVAVAGTTGALTGDGLVAATKMAKAALAELTTEGRRSRGIVEWVNEATVGVDQFLAKIPGMTTEVGRANAEMTAQSKETRQAYKALEDTASSMGYSIDGVNKIVAQGGPEFDQLVAKLRESGDAGNNAADQLVKVRNEMQQQIDSARNLSPAFTEASKAVDTLADSSSSADDKLGALKTLMQGMGLISQSAEQAMNEAADSIAEVADRAAEAADATGGFGSELLKADGSLDVFQANGNALADELSGMADELRQVSASGGDTAAVFERMQPNLDALAQKYGLTAEQMDGLVQKYGLVPETIDTLVNLTGVEGVEGDLVRVSGSLTALEGGKSIEITLEDEATKAKLTELGFKVESLPDGNTRIQMDDAEAGQKLLWWTTAGFPQIDMANPTATANLDASGLLYSTEYAKYQLATLDLQRPNPLASMDISDLNAAQVQALSQVGLLDGQTPTPAAHMDISALSAEQQIAMAQVFDLGAQTPTPAAHMDKSAFDAADAQARGQLNKLDNTTVTSTMRGDNAGVVSSARSALDWIRRIPSQVTTFFKGIFKSEGGVAGNAAGGIAGYASGGRLPVSGPGTHEVDGILGVDSFGLPVARVDAGEWVINRKQSAKYHDLLAAINRDDPKIAEIADLAGYAGGGVVSASELDQFARGLEGRPYVWGGVRWGDCSGAQSALANYAVGWDPWGSRFATGNEREELLRRGFTLGRGGPGDLRIGWFNGGPYGGHTAGTLPNGVNVEMGGARGNGQYGGPAAGSDDPQFTDHAYLSFTPDSWVAGETIVEYGDGVTANSLDDFSGLPGDEPVAAPTPDVPEAPSPSVSVAGEATSGDQNMVPVETSMRDAAATVFEATAGAAGDLLSHSIERSASSPLFTESTWSGLLGAMFGGGKADSVIGTFVGSQLADVLDVIGLPNEMPPVFKAGQQFMVGLHDAAGKMVDAAKAKDAITDTADAIDGAEEAVASAAEDDSLVLAIRRAAEAMGWVSRRQQDAVDELVAQDPAVTEPVGWSEAFAASMRRVDDAQAAAASWVEDIERRYGDPVNAVRSGEQVFDSGGVANGIGAMLKNTIKPERILSPEQTAAFNDFVFNKLPKATEAFSGKGIEAPGFMPADDTGTDAAGLVVDALASGAGQVDIGQLAAPVEGVVGDLLTDTLPSILSQKTVSAVAGQAVRSAVTMAGTAATKAAVSGVNLAGNVATAGVNTATQLGGMGLDAAGGVAEKVLSAVPDAASSVLGVVPGIGDAAGLVVDAAGQVAGIAGSAVGPATGLASAALSPVSGLATKGIGLATGLAGKGISAVGGIATNMASEYAGGVTEGVVGAFEQWGQEVFGSTLLGRMQDTLSVVMPHIGEAGSALAAIPQTMGDVLRDTPMPAVTTGGAGAGGGDVINFNTFDFNSAASMFRREQAKRQKGLVGAR